jgi:hypothetical protein
MVSGATTKGVRQYRCPSAAVGGCSSVHINAELFERDVIDRVLSVLDEGKLSAPDADTAGPTAKAEAELGRLEARKEQIAADLTLDLDLVAGQLKAIKQQIAVQAEIIRKDSLRAAQKAARKSALLLASRWDTLITEERRRLIEALRETITVGAAEPLGGVALRYRPKYDSERVSITWR